MYEHRNFVFEVLLGFLGHTTKEKHGEALPGMPFWSRDFAIAQYVAAFLGIEGSAVRAVDASYDLAPGLGLQNVEKPEPFALVIAVWLAQPLLMNGQSRLMH